MYVDCTSCPARRIACDGCMMNVLFDAPNSENADLDDRSGPAVTLVSARDPDADICAAVDTFRRASMTTKQDALSASRAITTGENGEHRARLSILRAG